MRKLLLASSALVLLGGAVLAANIPNVSGPGSNEPSQTNATINGVINAIEFGTSGWLASVAGPIASIATTTLQTFAGATTAIPTAQLNVPGQGVHVHCWGTTAANTDAKTAILRLGSNQVSANTSTSGTAWDLEFYQIANTTTANTGVLGRSMLGPPSAAAILASVVASQDTTDSLTNAETASCNYLQGTSAIDMTLQGFVVEQWK